MRNLPSFYLPSGLDAQPTNSPLAAILGAYALGIDTIESQKQQAQQILSIIGATGSWLDFLASLYGIPPRFGGESDALLLGRILQALTPGTLSNLQAILAPYSSQTPVIFEPMGGMMWNRTFSDWKEAPTTVTGTFTRASVAYDPTTGAQSSANTPIYQAGPFTDGLLMWGPVTNLLTANQSSFETGTTGATAVNSATLTQSATEHWSGSDSLSVVTPGTVVGEGFYVNVTSTTANDAYAGSVYLMGSGTVEVYLDDATNSVAGNPTTVTLTGSWQRVKDVTLTLGSVASTDLRLYVVTSGSAQAVTFYADGVQLEQSSFSNVWQIGGTARTADSLTITTPSTLSATSGTIQGWYTPSTGMLNGVGLWESNPGQTGSLQLQVYSGEVTFGVYGGSYATVTTSLTSATLLTGTWQATSTGTLITLYVGESSSAQATSSVAPTFASTLTYGSAGGLYADGILEDWRLQSYPKTQAGVESDYNTQGPLPASANTLALFSFNQSVNGTVGGDYEGSAFYLKVTVWASTQNSNAAYFDNQYFDNSYFGSSTSPSNNTDEIAEILATKVPAGIRTLVVQGG